MGGHRVKVFVEHISFSMNTGNSGVVQPKRWQTCTMAPNRVDPTPKLFNSRRGLREISGSLLSLISGHSTH